MRHFDAKIHRPETRTALLRYGFSILSTLAALLLTRLCGSLLQAAPWMLFIGAVAMSAWYGGTGPGALSILLASATSPLLPYHPQLSSLAMGSGVVAFAVIALLVSAVASSRRTLEARLEKAHNEGEALFEASPIGQFRMSGDGKLLRVNHSLLAILERPREEVIGRELAEVLGDPEAAGRVLGGLRQGRDLRGEEVLVKGKDGTRPLLLDTARLSTFPEEVQVAVRDISNVRKALDSLAKAREEVEAAGRARDQFLATLSHELRAPLTPVLIAASQEEEDLNLPPESRQMHELIRRNVELEARIIDNLLDLTMISQGKLELDINTVNTHALIKNVIELCQSEVNAKQLDLVVDLRANNCHVRGDSARLHQVFWNLIKNAVKFTPLNGRITVRSTDLEGGRLRISIIDSGIGIEGDRLRSIFNAFEHRANHQRFGGLGLGLTISKSIVEAHRGTLKVESEGRGKGATFTIEVPAMEVSYAEGTFSKILARITQPQPLRILLVEDHEDSARLIAQLLRKFNYQVTTAGTVQAALQAAESEEFDLLVSDIGLPDGNGLELLGQLRKRWPIKGIALTGFGMEADMKLTQEAGFVEHLTKPVNFQRLQMAIQRVAAFPKAFEAPSR